MYTIQINYYTPPTLHNVLLMCRDKNHAAAFSPRYPILLIAYTTGRQRIYNSITSIIITTPRSTPQSVAVGFPLEHYKAKYVVERLSDAYRIRC